MTEPNRLVEHFFRHEYGNLVSSLTRVFGFARIDLIEDMVGAAMLQAVNSWRQKGVPDRPAAWMHRVARNKILDALRREQNQQKALAFAGISSTGADPEFQYGDENIKDSLLRMMFTCCHPVLDRKSQIAITLKILCGFSVSEIAKGLFVSPEAAKKRIQRTKSQLAEQNLLQVLPSNHELPERLAAVHDVLYLMFNEGYSSSRGVEPIRDDVCEDAVRLCLVLCEHEFLSTAESRALLALMLFHAARMEARMDSCGNTVLLEDQDRSQWDRKLMEVANSWLVKSVDGQPSRFHLEAAIAQIHCSASSLQETDWTKIVLCYDRLIELSPSPIYKLNRAIALAQNGDSDPSLDELVSLREDKSMRDYFLLECAIGYAYEIKGETKTAIECYLKALSFDLAPHQKEQVKRRLNKLTG